MFWLEKEDFVLSVLMGTRVPVETEEECRARRGGRDHACFPTGLTVATSRMLQGRGPGGAERPGELSPTAPIGSPMTAATSIPEQVRSSKGDRRMC